MSNTYRQFRRSGGDRACRGSAIPQWRKQKPEIARAPSPPLSDIIAKVHQNELASAEETKDNPPKITGCTDVSSYNWLNKSEPTILTPGRPPAWTPLRSPIKLRGDDGEYFRDPNAARYSAHPMEPGVRAVLNNAPDFPTGDMDIVACSSTLGNLLRFVRKQDHSFRILVEVIGSTVFFVRRENSPTELIAGVYGYGHSFPDAYTTWMEDVKGSESHQRIIRYDFGGMNCLVRFEADGYLPHLIPGESRGTMSASNDDEPDGKLLSSLGNVALGINRPETLEKKKALNIGHGGQFVPQSAIFDLKTRSIKKKEMDILGEQMARLWVTQVPNFVLAFHKAGIFEEIEVHNVQKEVQKWQEDNQAALHQFATLLKKLVSFARSSDSGRLELRREEGSLVLEVRMQADGVACALPDDLGQCWTDVDDRYGEQPASPEDSGKYEEALEFDWNDEDEADFTACSANSCGYCGRCSY